MKPGAYFAASENEWFRDEIMVNKSPLACVFLGNPGPVVPERNGL
jgi:hypothetical protein